MRRPWSDRIDCDATIRGELQCQAAREMDHRGLGDTIGAETQARNLARDRGDIDNASAAALDHVAGSELGTVPDSFQVDGEHSL